MFWSLAVRAHTHCPCTGQRQKALRAQRANMRKVSLVTTSGQTVRYLKAGAATLVLGLVQVTAEASPLAWAPRRARYTRLHLAGLVTPRLCYDYTHCIKCRPFWQPPFGWAGCVRCPCKPIRNPHLGQRMGYSPISSIGAGWVGPVILRFGKQEILSKLTSMPGRPDPGSFVAACGERSASIDD